MEVMQRMIHTQALLFLYVFVGVMMHHAHIVKRESRKDFIGLLVNITLPCMILSSFNKPISSEDMHSAVLMVLLSILSCVLSGVLSFLLWRKKPKGERSVLQFATLFSNAGNAGLPVISLVYGDVGVFYASIFLIPIRLTMFTVGIALFAGTNGNIRTRITGILKNPSVFVVLIGFALMAFKIALPKVLSDAVRTIGDMTSPLAMMIIGMSLAEMKPREMMNRNAFLVSLVRLIVIPAVLFFLLRIFKIDSLATAVAITLASMPVATNTAIFAEQYDADYRFASKCVFISTVLSLLTVPLLTLLIETVKSI